VRRAGKRNPDEDTLRREDRLAKRCGNHRMQAIQRVRTSPIRRRPRGALEILRHFAHRMQQQRVLAGK
jgi:hypothetical protein